MKTRALLLSLGAFILLFSCKNDPDPGKEIGALQLSKQYPVPGDSLSLSYLPGDLEEDTEIEAFYHYFVGTKTYPEDLDFTLSEGVLKASLLVPDSATAIAFNFSKDGKVDNNGKKGYFLPLYTSTGELLPGSSANEGYFYHNMGFQYEVQNDSALAMIERDLRQYPELEAKWDALYSRILYSKDKEKGEAYVNNRIRAYSEKKNLSDEEYFNLTGFYATIDNSKASDSVMEIGRQKHPSGLVAEWYYSNKFHAEEDETRREEIFREFHQNMKDRKDSRLNYLAQSLAEKYAADKNWEKFEFYSGLNSDKGHLGNSLNSLAWSLAKKVEDLEKAQELSERSLMSLRDAEKPQYYTVKQHQKGKQYTERMFLDTYSHILFKRGKLQEAIENQEKAVADYKNSEYNERYLEYLMANKEYEKVEEKGAMFYSTFTATEKTKDYYAEAYKKINGSDEGLDQRLAELQQIGYEKALADTRKEMLDEEAPQFELKDLEGNRVSLQSLKGKTVIVDFWATWCGPCTASFPGMQMAVDKFEDDDAVQFLFVNTFEKGPDLKDQVKKLLEKDNYSFYVLMDENLEGTSEYKTTSAYGIQAIPTKVIIGPDGRLKFRKIGYGGNNDKLVQELSIMIDLLKVPAEAPATKEPVAAI